MASHERATGLRVASLTAAALVGFASNSLLCRLALAPRHADAATFTAVRLLSGAAVLVAVARWVSRSEPDGARGTDGSWSAALALFAYAAAFSFAYVRIAAGIGALLLFGAVQVTMLAGALRAGERPGRREWGGWALAFGGLVALVAPGLSAPDPVGAVLMMAAGVAWGLYSLLGRRASRPLRATMANFVRTAPLAIALVAAAPGPIVVTAPGMAAATTSGVLASGLGYSLWYAALPHLGAARAAIIQLAVPALTAAAAVVVLDEPLTLRLVVCASAILGGVALALLTRRVPPAPSRAQEERR